VEQHPVAPGKWPSDLITLREHYIELAVKDKELETERDRRYQEVGAERDQRYAEVKAAEEKALKVKETADLKALDLASQIQTYKDEKANELREQISQERSLYVTRDQLDGNIREVKTLVESVSKSIIELTRRMDKGEGSTSGVSQAKAETARTADNRIAAATAAIALLVIIVNVAVTIILH
jgi:hypothetical protein